MQPGFSICDKNLGEPSKKKVWIFSHFRGGGGGGGGLGGVEKKSSLFILYLKASLTKVKDQK